MSTLATTNLKNASSGSNNIVLNTDGTTTIAAPSNIIKSGTAVASTSGVAIDFTGLPSWVKRITVMFNGVSTNGTSLLQVQIGSGSFTTSGYLAGSADDLSSRSSYTTGFGIQVAQAVNLVYVTMAIRLVSGNTWLSTHNGTFNQSGSYYAVGGGGTVTLTGTLDRIRITTVNGTDTFDAGSINILYEG